MRTEKEINEILKIIDSEMQKNGGDYDVNSDLFRLSWVIRTTLLWVKGELENLK